MRKYFSSLRGGSKKNKGSTGTGNTCTGVRSVSRTFTADLVVRQHAGLLCIVAGMSGTFGRVTESVFSARRQRVRLAVEREADNDLRRVCAQFQYQLDGRVLNENVINVMWAGPKRQTRAIPFAVLKPFLVLLPNLTAPSPN